jgi:hypothetical protein
MQPLTPAQSALAADAYPLLRGAIDGEGRGVFGLIEAAAKWDRRQPFLQYARFIVKRRKRDEKRREQGRWKHWRQPKFQGFDMGASDCGIVPVSRETDPAQRAEDKEQIAKLCLLPEARLLLRSFRTSPAVVGRRYRMSESAAYQLSNRIAKKLAAEMRHYA